MKDAEVESPKCLHEKGEPEWDHWVCLKCGSVKPDGETKGRPNGGWFPTMGAFRAWYRLNN